MAYVVPLKVWPGGGRAAFIVRERSTAGSADAAVDEAVARHAGALGVISGGVHYDPPTEFELPPPAMTDDQLARLVAHGKSLHKLEEKSRGRYA